MEYVRQLNVASPEACIVKFCDVWANIADLPSGYVDDKDMKRTKQVNKKLVYFNAIKHGLQQDKFKDTDLQKGVDRLNKLLADYRRRIDLSDPPKAK